MRGSAGRDVEIKGLVNFGVFVDMGRGHTSQGLVHVSQLALERVEDPEDLFKLGDRIDVQVGQLPVTTCAA